MKSRTKPKLTEGELREQLAALGATEDEDGIEMHGFAYTMTPEVAETFLGEALGKPRVFRVTPSYWYLGPVDRALLVRESR